MLRLGVTKSFSKQTTSRPRAEMKTEDCAGPQVAVTVGKYTNLNAIIPIVARLPYPSTILASSTPEATIDESLRLLQALVADNHRVWKL
jgi:hypothetical protein